MSEYKVTNVRLPAETLRELRLRAAENGKSIAHLVRESIASYLENRSRPAEKDDDPFFSLGASGHSGLGDGSTTHDRHLYVEPSEAGNEPETVQVNGHYQIAMPKSMLQRLGISAGDRLLIEIRDDLLILTPEPKSYTTRLAGLHAEIWQDINTDDYLKEEREAWRSDYPKSSRPMP